jgi:hypothetical protein
MKNNQTKIFICYNCEQQFFNNKTLTKIDNCYYCNDCLKDLFIQCENCQEYHDKNNVTLVDNNYYCEPCFNELFYYCENCGEVINQDNVRIVDNNYYCENCFSDNCYTCENCGENGFLDNASRYDGNHYCDNCFSDLFAFCENCQEYYYRDDVIYNDDDDYYYCENCYDNVSLIRNYSYKPAPIFDKEKYENTLFIGFELEVETEYNNDTAKNLKNFLSKKNLKDRFYFKSDGSIEGFEVVTMPTTLKKYHSYNLKSILDYLKKLNCNSYDNKKCGLHLHVNKNFFNKQDLNKIVLFFNNNKEKIKAFSKRKNYYYCQIDNLNYTLNHYCKLYNYHNEERYSAINLYNRGTVEFRIFRGTLNHNRFLATLQFIDALCNFIKETSALSLSWNNFIDYLRLKNRYNHLENYLKENNLLK